jgi:hypothetical protein
MGWNPFFARFLERSQRASHPPPFPSIASASTARPYFYNIWDGNVDFGYALPTSLSIHGGWILLLVRDRSHDLTAFCSQGPFFPCGVSCLVFFHIRLFSERAHLDFVHIAERSERALDLLCLHASRDCHETKATHTLYVPCDETTLLYMTGMKDCFARWDCHFPRLWECTWWRHEFGWKKLDRCYYSRDDYSYPPPYTHSKRPPTIP